MGNIDLLRNFSDKELMDELKKRKKYERANKPKTPTDLELIRQWEKEEAAIRMRALGKCRCLDCENWRLDNNSSCKCIFKDVRVTNKKGELVLKYWFNTPGNWRVCEKKKKKKDVK